jgi:hypothetical protein
VGLNWFLEVTELLARRSTAWSEEFNEFLLTVEAAHKVISLVAPKYDADETQCQT